MPATTTPPSPKRLSQLYTIASQATRQPEPARTEADINQELIKREQIKNQDALQDIALKRKAFDRLFLLLSVETALVFLFALLQATHWFGFSLEEWSFKLLTTATLVQVAGMLLVAVRYLFPSKGGK